VRHWQGWYRHITLSMLAHASYPCCERVEKKFPTRRVRRSVRELRHLLTAMLWRGWHGVEHLLQLVQVAKAASIPGHVLPLSKARINPARIVSTTVVRSEQYYV